MTFTTFGFSQAQDWITSLDIAKRLALVQNKMIFAVWEGAADYQYPVLIDDDKEGFHIIDLFANDSITSVIGKYFIPVLIPENSYTDLYSEIQGKRSYSYIQKFNDDSIKIMDINANILNAEPALNEFVKTSLSELINTYALNTSYLNQELRNYSKARNFTTSFRLAAKYLDFAILSNPVIRTEIAELSDIYMKEAKAFLKESNVTNKPSLSQRVLLLEIKKLVIENKPRKALRMLKKLDASEISDNNQSLYAFLNFACYRLLNDMENAMIWQNKVSLVDLKKMKILANN